MRKLDLTPEGSAIVMGVLAQLGLANASSVSVSGSIAAFDLDVPDPIPKPLWICQPIKFEPSGSNPEYRSIASCSICGEKVWKDKRALTDVMTMCYNCAIADMLDHLGIDIEVMENMIPVFGSG